MRRQDGGGNNRWSTAITGATTQADHRAFETGKHGGMRRKKVGGRKIAVEREEQAIFGTSPKNGIRTLQNPKFVSVHFFSLLPKSRCPPALPFLIFQPGRVRDPPWCCWWGCCFQHLSTSVSSIISFFVETQIDPLVLPSLWNLWRGSTPRYTLESKHGSILLVDEDQFLWCRCSRTGHKQYLRCALRTCESRGYLEETDRLYFVIRCPHNHPPDLDAVAKLRFRQRLRQLAATTELPYRQIYAQCLATDARGAQLAGSLKQCKKIMQFARQYARTVHDFEAKLCISISEPTETAAESVDPLELQPATATLPPVTASKSSGPSATSSPSTPPAGETPPPAIELPQQEPATAIGSTIQRKRIIYVRPFDGEIQPGDLQLITDELSTELAEDEILCEALYIGIDAGLKSQVLHYPDGITMIGGQIARVAASRCARFPVGAHIYGKFGWQTHTVTSGAVGDNLSPYLLPADIFGDAGKARLLPISLGLGCLGVTGNTALVALQEILKPRAGETLLVTAAAGGVGNLVGQLAKALYQCRVVGICGTDQKCKWLLNTAQFDAAVCYRSRTFAADLRLATGAGVDVLFDSVGGEVFGECVRRMNERGRIAVNGSLAAINEKGLQAPQTCLDVHRYFVAQQLTMRGFCVWDHGDQWMQRMATVGAALSGGLVRNFETVLDGFERCPEALESLIRGEYRGRVVVRVQPLPVEVKAEKAEDG